MSDFSGYEMNISCLARQLSNKELYIKIIKYVENIGLEEQEEKYKLTIVILKNIVRDPFYWIAFVGIISPTNKNKKCSG